MTKIGKNPKAGQGVSRRDFIKSSSLSLLGVSLAAPQIIHAAPSFDIVIKGATVVDGTGASAWKADVGITGDTITCGW